MSGTRKLTAILAAGITSAERLLLILFVVDDLMHDPFCAPPIAANARITDMVAQRRARHWYRSLHWRRGDALGAIAASDPLLAFTERSPNGVT